jgi:hypothetical protein
MSLFGIMDSIRSDGGTQFTANICKGLAKVMGFTHHIILPYHPQANGLVERRNAEVMKHLRALVLVERDKDKWSLYLPLVQRILNATNDTIMGVCPAKLIFGNQLPILTPLLVEKQIGHDGKTPEVYIDQISAAMELLVERSLFHIAKENGIGTEESGGFEFKVGDYAMITYPTKPPHKLSPLYRGPCQIVAKVRDDIFSLKDLVSGKVINFHVDRLRLFNLSSATTDETLMELAAADKDEFIVEMIVDHRGSIKKRSKMEFRIRWQGFDESEDTWLLWREVKDLVALDIYIQDHAELLGL